MLSRLFVSLCLSKLESQMKTNQQITVLLSSLVVVALASATSAWGLDSCNLEHPSEIVSFQQGSLPAAAATSTGSFDPKILLRTAASEESLILGLGGSVTLKFTVPIANYPASGALTIERPQSAATCSSNPVRAQISGSIDGEHFIPLGTLCESAAIDLGTLPWIAYLRITDVTDPSDPAFTSNSAQGFDLRSVSGPGCLKYSHCAVTASPDPTVSTALSSYALSSTHLGDDFVLQKRASFEEYGNGSARLSGTVYRKSDPTAAYDMIISLTGRVTTPPTQSPLLELKTSAYTDQGGTIDTASWYYYKTIKGWLIGKNSRSGDTIAIGDTIHSMQIGDGAHGRNTSLGAGGSFAYNSESSQQRADLRIGLTSCSLTENTPTPTPAPTATPGDRTITETPQCQTQNLSNNLAALDHTLFRRLSAVNHATRILLQEVNSPRNRRYRADIRAKAQNLYALGWTNIWKHDRVIHTCTPATLCSEVHLEATQASIAASARTLDLTVKNSLLYVYGKVKRPQSKRAIMRLTQSHSKLQQAFLSELAKLPQHSMRCE
jgi:hypothetical protein